MWTKYKSNNLVLGINIRINFFYFRVYNKQARPGSHFLYYFRKIIFSEIVSTEDSLRKSNLRWLAGPRNLASSRFTRSNVSITTSSATKWLQWKQGSDWPPTHGRSGSIYSAPQSQSPAFLFHALSMHGEPFRKALWGWLLFPPQTSWLLYLYEKPQEFPGLMNLLGKRVLLISRVWKTALER